MKQGCLVNIMSCPMTNNVGLTLVLVTLYRGLQLVLSKSIRIGDTIQNSELVMSKTIRIGDTKYHI